MKGVITMYNTTAIGSPASVDMQADGILVAVGWQLNLTGNAADGDGAVAELSFGSSADFTTNDARQIISGCIMKGDLVGAAANFYNASVNYQEWLDGIPFFGGERVYLHVSAVTGSYVVRARLLVDFKGNVNIRRR